MRLYLVRHGKAERDSATGRDEDRTLTDRGERQADWLGLTLARLPAGERPRVIFTSPAVRARETARRIHARAGGEFREDPALRLGAPPDETLALVERAALTLGAAAFVGHNPVMEALALLLPRDAPEGQDMKTGQAVVLDAPAQPPFTGRCTFVARWRMDD
jgi:phosphohistidine phosphatase